MTSKRVRAALLLAAAAGIGSAEAVTTVDRIPLMDGLVIVSAFHSDAGDRENVVVVSGSAAAGVRYDWTLVRQAASGEPEEAQFSRHVRTEDLATATRLNAVFRSEDREDYPGFTAFTLSAATLKALRGPGTAPFGIMSLPDGSTNPFSRGVQFKGTLKRVSAASEPFSVVLNTRRVQVPAMRIAGRFTYREHPLEQTLWVLDDPSHPLILKVQNGNDVFQVVRIETPLSCSRANRCVAIDTDKLVDEMAPGKERELHGEAASAPALMSDMEDELGKRCRAELPGVFFDFATANLNRASFRALDEVAQILSRHPDWALTVEGHTDDIGSDASNLALSRARAQSVRAYLSAQRGIPAQRLIAAGYGESMPRESNTTLEGRASNRRVEIVRACQK